MPSKHIIKNYLPNSYFHIYNRGVNKNEIYKSEQDKQVFLNILDRYLNLNSDQLDANNLPYQKFNNLELSAYCLMNNHYHFLLWVGNDPTELPGLMRAIGTSYSSYFNKRYERVGPLFQSRYKASTIISQEHLAHITRYIHLNPEDYLHHKFSSLGPYLGKTCPPWLQPNRVIKEIDIDNYLTFLKSA